MATSNPSTFDLSFHEVGTGGTDGSFFRGGFAFENGAVWSAGLAFVEGVACLGACEGE